MQYTNQKERRALNVKYFDNKCECCGKEFVSKHYTRKFCSKSCYAKFRRKFVTTTAETFKNSHICWECDYYVNCKWVLFRKPVEGWTATVMKIHDNDSYCVSECPNFVKGARA